MQAKSLIRKALEERNMSMAQLVVLLQENGIQTSYSNLHNKLQRDSLKYTEVLEIMHVLEFEVKIQNKHIPQPIVKSINIDDRYKSGLKKIMINSDHVNKQYIKDIVDDHINSVLKEALVKSIKCEIAEEIGINITKKKPPSRGGY